MSLAFDAQSNFNLDTMSSLTEKDQKAKEIPISDWNRLRHNKKSEYNYLKTLGVYLPPIDFTTRRWLAFLFEGKLNFIWATAWTNYKAKNWKTLTVQALLAGIANSAKKAVIQRCLPPLTRTGGTMKIHREWLINVIKHHDPDILD